jgi:hypothetical protein
MDDLEHTRAVSDWRSGTYMSTIHALTASASFSHTTPVSKRVCCHIHRLLIPACPICQSHHSKQNLLPLATLLVLSLASVKDL